MKTFKKLFLVSELVNEEQSKYSIYESINPTRIQLFTLMNDNDKKEVLTNENYIRNTAGEHDIFYNKFKLAEQLKDDYLDIIQKISTEISIHDFRVVHGTTHTNILFDVAIPCKFQYSPDELRNMINNEIHKIGDNYIAIINVDQLYVTSVEKN